jgi:predicted hydrocarbon binding protein
VASNEPAQAHYGLVVKPIPKPLNTALRQVDSMNIIRAIRPRMGRETSQWMFRGAYFLGLLQAHGKDFHPWSLLAGRKFGQFVQLPDYESVDKAFRSMKIGRVIWREEANSVTFDVEECMICYGMMGLDEPCCGFVGGLLGSVVGRVTGRDVVVKETRCGATNHDVCRFEVSFSRGIVGGD